ncbi:hypothetical protein QBC34DRAFT_495799 [Podospora aff. communis PSN243]|uniref:Ecp2 effector protein domain-containing protein n=1 Tax=Podospora aff. communis PSN243 TaxID=3040156 RepID=A0AAV9GI18_9PEZI|nr:hypothetical protein QBC34DRAFT_495799 [Podospora aff. communis PSN243]
MGKTLVTLLALATISCGVVASPMPMPRPAEDGASAIELFGWKEGAGVHLVECSPLVPAEEGSDVTSKPENSWLSLVIYCDDDKDCADIKHIPSAQDVCVKKMSNVTGDFQKWESSEWVYCHFDERGWFSWALSRFARLFPPATEVGIAEIGEEGNRHGFAGYVDDLSQGAGPATHNCSKVYYFS